MSSGRGGGGPRTTRCCLKVLTVQPREEPRGGARLRGRSRMCGPGPGAWSVILGDSRTSPPQGWWAWEPPSSVL